MELGVSDGLLEDPVALLQDRCHSCSPGENSCTGALPFVRVPLVTQKTAFSAGTCAVRNKSLREALGEGKESPSIPPHLFSIKTSAYPSQLPLPRVCSQLPMGMVSRQVLAKSPRSRARQRYPPKAPKSFLRIPVSSFCLHVGKCSTLTGTRGNLDSK